MLNFKRLVALCITVVLMLSAVACGKPDTGDEISSSNSSGTSDSSKDVTSEQNYNNVETEIKSLDRVMSNYFDISLFDEENYANIYLGSDFKINALYNSVNIPVPAKFEDLKRLGWSLAPGNTHDEKSLVFAYESVNITLVNAGGKTLSAQIFNSSKTSEALADCFIVKFTIENDYYLNQNSYNEFNINGITNSLAITDIIDILGTPSHFYRVSDTSYYLDYFITKKDRRNGITIYINPAEDLITKIEFSYYK